MTHYHTTHTSGTDSIRGTGGPAEPPPLVRTYHPARLSFALHPRQPVVSFLFSLASFLTPRTSMHEVRTNSSLKPYGSGLFRINVQMN